MPQPLSRRRQPPLQRNLEQALQSGDAQLIYGAARALAHVAELRGRSAVAELEMAGRAFVQLVARGDAPAFSALDAALCLRATAAEDEYDKAAFLAAGPAPLGPVPVELCARWALAGRWLDLAALPVPATCDPSGPFGPANADVALAIWHRARYEGLPLDSQEAAAAAEAEHRVWLQVANTLLPLRESFEARRASMLWEVLLGDPATGRLKRAGWRFWAIGEGFRIYDEDGRKDGAPEWLKAREQGASPTRRWWGARSDGISTVDSGPLPIEEARRAAGVVQRNIAWFERHGWSVHAQPASSIWMARRGNTAFECSRLDKLAERARDAMGEAAAPRAGDEQASKSFRQVSGSDMIEKSDVFKAYTVVHEDRRSQAYNEATRKHLGFVAAVEFGLYTSDEGTLGLMALRWYMLSGEAVPRLEAFAGSWYFLLQWPDLVEALATHDRPNLTPAEFTVILDRLGFVDRTKR